VVKLKQSLDLNDKLAIVYTGTFERYQGLGLLFKSAQIVVEQFPEVVFVMVGGQPEQIRHRQNQVQKLGLEDNVIFVGIVSLDESQKYLALADILVSPRTEGLSIPLKIYSYLHSGKPSVVTNIFAHTQILDEGTAVIADVEPEAFADGILKLAESPDLRAQMGERAKAYAEERFSEESYLAKLEKAYLAIQLSVPINEIPPGRVRRRTRSALS
jgi:glycosyltransferase involved in cell wall biosynthesis